MPVDNYLFSVVDDSVDAQGSQTLRLTVAATCGHNSAAGHPDTESDHDPEKLVTLRLVTPEPTAATVPLPSAPSVKCCAFWFAANLHNRRMMSPASQAADRLFLCNDLRTGSVGWNAAHASELTECSCFL